MSRLRSIWFCNWIPYDDLPEHLNSCSCRSATFCPLSCDGDWHLVYGARRGALRKNRDSQDKWQSHAKGLSERRNARKRLKALNVLWGSDVKLLLLSVLQQRETCITNTYVDHISTHAVSTTMIVTVAQIHRLLILTVSLDRQGPWRHARPNRLSGYCPVAGCAKIVRPWKPDVPR